MHPAPAASHPVGARPAQLIVVVALSGAGAVAVLAWWASGAASPPALAVAAGLWLAALLWALAAVRRAPAGRLCWDGARWRLDGPAAVEAAQAPEIVMDLQTVMLLRWSVARPAWLWVARDDDPTNWADLRRALRAAASAGGGTGGAPR